MTKYYLTFLLLFTLTNSIAQQQKTIAKFIISDATINDVDVTETYLAAGGYLAFYSTGDGNLYMTNFMSKRHNSQSYGRLYAAETKNLNETYDNYEADIFFFRWHYINTYDKKRGTATVKFIKIYKPQGVTFICTIVPEDLDICVYKGYMEGSLDFSDYSK